MWPREAGIRPYEQGNEDKVIRAPWQEGAVVSPGTGWFHQHFGTGSTDQKPVRQLALRPSGVRTRLASGGPCRGRGPRLVSEREVPSLTFDLEDPRVRRDFKAELATKGLPLSHARGAGTVVDILSSVDELARGSVKSFKRFKPFKTFETERSG